MYRSTEWKKYAMHPRAIEEGTEIKRQSQGGEKRHSGWKKAGSEEEEDTRSDRSMEDIRSRADEHDQEEWSDSEAEEEAQQELQQSRRRQQS